MRQGIENIKTHPKKFMRNVAANISRMCFSFPYSYTPQKLTTLFYVLPNAFLLSWAGHRRRCVVGAASAGNRRLSPGARFHGVDVRGKLVALRRPANALPYRPRRPLPRLTGGLRGVE